MNKMSFLHYYRHAVIAGCVGSRKKDKTANSRRRQGQFSEFTVKTKGAKKKKIIKNIIMHTHGTYRHAKCGGMAE